MSAYIDDLALEAAERYVQTGRDLSEIIADIAGRNDLNLEQIKRVIERANRTVFLKLFAHKIHEFPIASLERVMEYLNGRALDETESLDEEFDESWYDWDEFEELDPEEVAREVMPKPERSEPDRLPEKYQIALVSVTQMKKVANDILASSMTAKAAFEDLVGLIEEALKWVPPNTLREMVLQKTPLELRKQKEYNEILDEAINEALKRKKKEAPKAKGSARKVAAYVVTVAGKRSKYADVAKLMSEENVTPEEVISCLHDMYKTTLFDHVVARAAATKQASEQLKNEELEKRMNASEILSKIGSIATALDKLGGLVEDLELYRQTAEEAAVTPELANMVAREWSKICKRQMISINQSN